MDSDYRWILPAMLKVIYVKISDQRQNYDKILNLGDSVHFYIDFKFKRFYSDIKVSVKINFVLEITL